MILPKSDTRKALARGFSAGVAGRGDPAPYHRAMRDRPLLWWTASLGALVALLVLTGVWLALEYRPPLGGDGRGFARTVHSTAAALLFWSAIASVVAVLARRVLRRRWALAVAGLLLVAAASFTGYLLPWDQLALRSVTTGNNLRGIRWLFDGEVRFVLVGGTEISVSTYRAWAIVHVAIGAVLAAGAVLVLRRSFDARAPVVVADEERSRRERDEDEPDDDGEGAADVRPDDPSREDPARQP
jgi:quinol-cytochrome oxidoreductase complex cytochrome b subunit